MLDTARFKYPPHWVDRDELFKSLVSIDNDTKKTRGFIVLAKKQ